MWWQNQLWQIVDTNFVLNSLFKCEKFAVWKIVKFFSYGFTHTKWNESIFFFHWDLNRLTIAITEDDIKKSNIQKKVKKNIFFRLGWFFFLSFFVFYNAFVFNSWDFQGLFSFKLLSLIIFSFGKRFNRRFVVHFSFSCSVCHKICQIIYIHDFCSGFIFAFTFWVIYWF